MAKSIIIHPQNPQNRLIKKVIETLQLGGVIIYPTDSGYALGCMLGNKAGLDRIRMIRGLDKHHHFTLMMRNLSHIGEYAKLDNMTFRLLKRILPGAYTFILQATRDVPNRLLHPKRKTIGLRIPNHHVIQAILKQLHEPMMSVSLVLEQVEFYDVNDIISTFAHQVNLIVNSGYCPTEPTTVIDCTQDVPRIIRQGLGDTSLIA